MQPKNRMTFRFDSPPKPQQDKLSGAPRKREEDIHAEPPAESPKTESSSAAPDRTAGGPLQDDPYTLEELIRSYETQTSYSPAAGLAGDFSGGAGRSYPMNETENDPAAERMEKKKFAMPEGPEIGTAIPNNKRFHWDVDADRYGWTPQDDASGEWKVPRQTYSGGPSWWRALAAVAGAIGTGALFGYLVLTLFTGEPVFSTGAGGRQDQVFSPAQPTAEAPASGRVTTGATESPNLLPGAAAMQTLPEETYYFLQYGVFQTDDGLEAALAALKNRGLPAAGDRTDGYRAYAGAAPSREVAELLASQMPDVEVYIKTVAVEPVEAMMPAESGNFIASSHELARQLLRLSAMALQDELPQPFEEAELTALQENHRLWLQTVSAANMLPGAQKQAGEDIIRAINEAMAHVEDYHRKLSRYHLWGIQMNMMELILADQKWRASL